MFEFQDKENPAECEKHLEREFIWVQSSLASKALRKVQRCLKKSCQILHVSHKCDPTMNLPIQQSICVKYILTGKHGGDNVKANVSLLDDNVIQAEVAIKHPKTPGGTFRAMAQPDVQWKLSQIQDLGNHVSRASLLLSEMTERMDELHNNGNFNLATGDLVLAACEAIKEEIAAARQSILIPKKKSLLELCHFPPTRKFVPPLPQDLLLSFYISSARLVCAAYQMVPKQSVASGLQVSLAECQLPYLDEVLKHLNVAQFQIQRVVEDLRMTQKH